MKEYKIKITGRYDVIVLSPKMIALLIEKVRGSDTKELVIPAEEFFSQRYAEYLSRFLEANVTVAEELSNRNVYTLVAEQIRKMRFDEKDCFDNIDVTELESRPQFDVEASKEFYIVTKQENSQFHYTFQNAHGEEISIVLEYL